MTAGIIVACAGLAVMFTGGRMASVRLRERHGKEIFGSPEAINATAGTGVVPTWVSGVTLTGWGLLIAGIIITIVSAV